MKRKAVVSFVFVVLLLVSVFPLSTFSGAADSHGNAGPSGSQSTGDPTDWWPMFHHDLTHTGYSTSTAPITNQTLWNYTTGNKVDSSPAVADGVVYVGSLDDRVYALNATTGTQVWNYTTGGWVASSPAVVGGVVYVGSYDYNVYALNATTGTLIWRSTTVAAVFSSPAVVGGVVYVGSGNYYVYALNATTGAGIWSYTTGLYVLSSPAVVGGVVYVGSEDDKVYALNATTGAPIWSYTTSNAVASSPAVVGGVVYVGSDDNKTYALNATTGAPIWSFATNYYVFSSPAVVGGVVYVGSDDNKTYALNATTGAQVWSYTTGSYVESSPAVVGGVVYVGSLDDRVYALNATTGAFVWSYTTGSYVESSPAVVGGMVYVGSADGRIYDFGWGVSTPTGTNVTVAFPAQNVSVTFDNVTSAGFTILDTAEPPNSLFPSVACVEMTTTATYNGNVTLTFPYDPDGLSLQDQQAMKIWLWNDSSSCWVDITTNVNTISHVVYGISPHLSMFGVTCDLGISGDLGVTGITTVSIPENPPPPPSSYWVALNYYQINTTKVLPAPISLSLAYNYQNIQPGQELSVQIMMWNDTSLRWVDITTGVDLTSHIVYGLAPHLSMFGVTCLQSSPTVGGGGGSQMPYMN